MKLFLIRHGEAIDYETESVKSDDLRFLSPEGRKTSREVFRKIKGEFLGLDVIYTSPLIRAVQTAEILANILRFENDVEIANELGFSSVTAKVLELIRRNSKLGSIALIGHEPMIGGLVGNLSGGKLPELSFKKSGVCLIDFDCKKETGSFLWYFDPKIREFIK